MSWFWIIVLIAIVAAIVGLFFHRADGGSSGGTGTGTGVGGSGSLRDGSRTQQK